MAKIFLNEYPHKDATMPRRSNSFSSKPKAHKIVTKRPGTFRYRVTGYSQKVLARILMFKKLDLKFC